MDKVGKRIEYAKIFAKGATKYTNLRKAEAYIIGFIFNKFPEDSIYSKESGEIKVNNSKYCWDIEIREEYISIEIKTDIKIEEKIVYKK